MSDLEDEEIYESGEEAQLEGEEGEREEGEEEEGEEEGEEEEKEPEPDPVLLRQDDMSSALSMLSRIGPGLSHAYIKCDIAGRELTDISLLESFVHIRYLNIQSNDIKDIKCISGMTNLLTLNANENRIQKVELDEMPYLQVASLDKNRITSMEGLVHPNLDQLSVEYNLIDSFYVPEPDKYSCLRILSLRGNKLVRAAAQYPRTLKQLYLASNLLENLHGMEGLENLEVLHLRENQITSLDGLDSCELPSLKYINLRGNNLEDVKEFKKLADLPSLAILVLQDNPMGEEDDYRVEMLAYLGAKKTMYRIDKDEIDPDEMDEAQSLIEQWAQEEAVAEAEEEMERMEDQKQQQQQEEV